MKSINNSQEPVQSLDELVAALSEGERTTYTDIIRSMEINSSVFEEFCSWSEESYTRNCLFDNEKFELILLCWEPKQMTPIHDHGGEECWVKVLDGEFKERIYDIDENDEPSEITSAISETNDITYMIDFMGFHSLENLSNDRSMSLHLYAKPIRSCNMYDEELGELINKDLVYDTISECIEI